MTDVYVRVGVAGKLLLPNEVPHSPYPWGCSSAQALLRQQTSISKRHLEAQQAWGLIICDSKVSVLSTDHAARLHWLYETMYGIE